MVGRRRVYVPTPVAALLVRRGRMNPNSASGADSGRTIELSIRQRDVLQLLWQGETNKAIARKLNIGEGTVNVHIRNIMKMLGARNRTQVVLLTKQLLQAS